MAIYIALFPISLSLLSLSLTHNFSFLAHWNSCIFYVNSQIWLITQLIIAFSTEASSPETISGFDIQEIFVPTWFRGGIFPPLKFLFFQASSSSFYPWEKSSKQLARRGNRHGKKTLPVFESSMTRTPNGWKSGRRVSISDLLPITI